MQEGPRSQSEIPMDSPPPSSLRDVFKNVDGVVLTAGAGMGIDSGLPDFRGSRGFWKAYPALGQAKLSFQEVASPRTFREDPRLAWGFYGHRLTLYRNTVPHRGFALLHRIADRIRHGAFVFTSNVDGQFSKSGTPEDRILECHGSIHFLQCMDDCRGAVWPCDDLDPEVDTEHIRLCSELPLCPFCGGLARPNILMFDDSRWNSARAREQSFQWHKWRERCTQPVVIEIGAGTAIPTVRHFGESLGCPLLRINPREPQVFRPRDMALNMGAVEGIRLIARALGIREEDEREK